jgi:putative transposase
MRFLQDENLPFLTPVMFRGRRSKKRVKATGLRAMRLKPAGWYSYTMKSNKQEVTFRICVGYRTYLDRKKGKVKRTGKKLLFAAWRVNGTPTEIRQLYRKRFGIETSYRQMRQARIYTCTRDPHLRLFFLAVGLILRNIWVWFHQMCFAEGSRDNPTLHLECLRFKRMLDWIAHEVIALYHDGSPPCAIWPP